MDTHDDSRFDNIRFVDGLIPAVVQDAGDKAVLMVAWMNRRALAMTLQTRETHFFSRSRGKIWHKGETSGYVQKVTAVTLDCDRDTLLVTVAPVAVACHTGRRSCFFHPLTESQEPAPPAPDLRPLDALCQTIAERKRHPSDDSYTSRLLAGGLDVILKKVAEESGEFLISAKNGEKAAILHEAADLLYHLLVALAHHDIPLSAVEAALAARAHQSGLQEKQTREQ